MTQVTRKGFVDKNGKKVVIVLNVPGATAGNLASFDAEGNPQDSGKKPSDFVPNVPGATEGNLPKFDAEGNLLDSGIKSTLFGLRISFIRDENGDYAIDSELKQALNEILTLIPFNTSVPCYVQTQWWNEDLQQYSSAEYPGALCCTKIVGPRITTTIYLSFAGNYFYATRTNKNDFPNTWTKFENPFEVINKIHTLEYEDGSYESRIGVGQLGRDDDELDGASVYGKDAIRLGVSGGLVYIDAENIANLQRALEDPAAPESGGDRLISNGQVWDAIADLAYAETLNRRKLNIGGIYLIKGTTLADYTIENISTSAMQLYISGIAEIGRGRIDHLVIGLKDGATTYELLSTVYVEDPNRIELYIGDIVVIIGRNSQSVWELGSVTKISSLF